VVQLNCKIMQNPRTDWQSLKLTCSNVYNRLWNVHSVYYPVSTCSEHSLWIYQAILLLALAWPVQYLVAFLYCLLLSSCCPLVPLLWLVLDKALSYCCFSCTPLPLWTTMSALVHLWSVLCMDQVQIWVQVFQCSLCFSTELYLQEHLHSTSFNLSIMQIE